MPGVLVVEQIFACIYGDGYFPTTRPDQFFQRLKVAVGVGVAGIVCCLAYIVFDRVVFDVIAFLALLVLVYLMAFVASCYVTMRNRRGSFCSDGNAVSEMGSYSVLRQDWGHEFRCVKITHEALGATLSFVCLTETFNDFRGVSVSGRELVFEMPVSCRTVKRLSGLSGGQNYSLKVLAENVETDDHSYAQVAGTLVIRCVLQVG